MSGASRIRPVPVMPSFLKFLEMLVLPKLWIGRLETRGDYKAEKDRPGD